MKKVTLYLHAFSLIFSLLLFGFAHLMGSMGNRDVALLNALGWSVPTLAGISFFAGIAAMAQRSGKTESFALAISTIAAFLWSLMVSFTFGAVIYT